MFHTATERNEPVSPPWQVLDLVAHHLDPTNLAAACCVSKSWRAAMSSDHLWHPICAADYPSLTNLHSAAKPTLMIPYHKLHSLGRSADTRRRQNPPKPRLSVSQLLFAIDVRNTRNNTLATVVVPGGDLKLDKNGLFRFDIDVDAESGGDSIVFEALEGLRITWNVVLREFEGVFTVMDCKGKGSFVLGLEGWFSKELPSAGCCGSSGGGTSGLVADLRLGLREIGGGRVVVEKVSVGVLSVVSWRYVLVDDALRYLQHFLLPSFDGVVV